MSLRSFIDDTSILQVKLESAAPATSYTTNAVGFTWGALTFNQWVMGITLILGVLTFVVNLYFQWRRNERDRLREKREHELHRVRMAAASREEPQKPPTQPPQ